MFCTAGVGWGFALIHVCALRARYLAPPSTGYEYEVFLRKLNCMYYYACVCIQKLKKKRKLEVTVGLR